MSDKKIFLVAGLVCGLLSPWTTPVLAAEHREKATTELTSKYDREAPAWAKKTVDFHRAVFKSLSADLKGMRTRLSELDALFPPGLADTARAALVLSAARQMKAGCPSQSELITDESWEAYDGLGGFACRSKEGDEEESRQMSFPTDVVSHTFFSEGREGSSLGFQICSVHTEIGVSTGSFCSRLEWNLASGTESVIPAVLSRKAFLEKALTEPRPATSPR